MQAARRVGPGVQVAGCGGDVGVAQRRLHLGQRGAAVNGMRAVRVAQPVRRHFFETRKLSSNRCEMAVGDLLGGAARLI